MRSLIDNELGALQSRAAFVYSVGPAARGWSAIRRHSVRKRLPRFEEATD